MALTDRHLPRPNEGAGGVLIYDVDAERHELAERVEIKAPPPAEDRRLAIILLSAELLVGMFTEGPHCYVVTENPIPDDARVKACRYDLERDWWEVIVWSASFEPVPEHVALPRLPSTVASLVSHAARGD